MSRSSREAGSIFLESVAAAALLAVVLAGAYRVMADSFARRHQLEARRYALMVARSALASVGSVVPLAPGAMEGEDGGDIWRVDLQPCGSGAPRIGRLYCITVSVREGGDRQPLVTLTTRRFGPQA